MKYVKVLGLAAVAAMALMAFLGASTASATVLCKTQLTSGCAAAGWAYPSGTLISASLEASATLETTGGTPIVTCETGLVEGSTTNAGSSADTVDGNLSKLEFGGCTRTVDVLNKGSLEVHWISGTDNGTVTSKSAEVTINTPFGNCVYGTAATGTHIGTITATPGGSKMATLHI